MQIIENTLKAVTIGTELSFSNLKVTSLVAANDEHADYATLDEALMEGSARVTETSEAGNVPELKFENKGSKAVLLLDGEELIGAKQNRVLNLTILAPASETITIPVSCVEAGRWSRMSPDFSTEGRAFYARGRARKMRQVTDSLRHTGTRRSRQGDVWNDIHAKSMRMNSVSATRAMSSIYEDYEAEVDGYVNAVNIEEGQVGAIFAINGRIRGMELFDFASTFRKLSPKLIRSYALDAIDEKAGEKIEPEDPAPFLESISRADGTVHEAIGEGEDIRLSATAIAGGALNARNRVVHLCAFAMEASKENPERGRAPMSRSSWRRRHYQQGQSGPDLQE